MNRSRFYLIAVAALWLLLSFTACQNNRCQNGGTLVGENCTCPVGYLGTHCDVFDSTQVQALLAHHAPFELFQAGIALDSLYGKRYEGGLIFYLNTDDGTGMVAATEDQGQAEWGCPGLDIVGLNDVQSDETEVGARVGDGPANTKAIIAECPTPGIAARICDLLVLNGKDDWFLPSHAELDLIYKHLQVRGHSAFAPNWYWSSSENGAFDASWFQHFRMGRAGGGQLVAQKYAPAFVRAARAF